MAHKFNIQSGPSLMDLNFALFYGSTAEQNRHLVRFQVGEDSNPQIKSSIKVQIEGLKREDGSGNNWFFSGYQVLSTGRYANVNGFYNSQSRTGHLDVE